MSIRARFQICKSGFDLDVEFQVPARGITAIFGPSGSGKTTLLRAIAGLENDPRGAFRIGDEVWQDGTHSLPTHRRPLGYVFQEASLFDHLSVRGNLEYGFKRVPIADRRITLEEAVALMGLEKLIDRDPAGLSGGERQRVAVARALLTSPRLLLMDEPLAALDRASKQDILPYLERLHGELACPVLYVSHAADEVARLADHLVLMELGRVKASGPLDELFTRLDLAAEQGPDAEAVITATVAGHDAAFHLTHLDFSGGRLLVARNSLPDGCQVRVRVMAKDVSITLEEQTDTSILNIFPAVVDGLVEESPAQTLVRLKVGEVPTLARITRKSAATLELAPGKRVFAQIKAVALVD